ncbi:hypothetical protein CGMCC3_g17569 [Colletotrichum fructicola]|nr:uncharacterized protein CGMCC3_g17569 [Colletotrichum fructicola]KAE9566262.1 hypothetical protein CGMCC3_g17569 [Colletotrichum fructicola]
MQCAILCSVQYFSTAIVLSNLLGDLYCELHDIAENGDISRGRVTSYQKRTRRNRRRDISPQVSSAASPAWEPRGQLNEFPHLTDDGNTGRNTIPGPRSTASE